MGNKPIIQLWESVGLGVIIAYPTGVLCSNQTGGTSCLHPQLEGVFVPLRNDCLEETRELISPENDLIEYFTGSKYKGTGATLGLDKEDAYFIETLLAKHGLSPAIHVDHDQLKESHEAWVHVIILGDEHSILPVFSGFGNYPKQGVLTWANSD